MGGREHEHSLAGAPAWLQLLDLLEVYLNWRKLPDGRRMGHLRIDGSTSLEDRHAPMT